MTASNPCCKECFLPERDGPTFYSHAAGYALPEACKDEECECHQSIPAAVEKERFWCDNGYSCRCTCHQTSYQIPTDFPKPQPEKEWWEEEFDKFNDFFDKYDSDNWFARGQIKLLFRKVAAQSEKKGRDACADYIKENCPIIGKLKEGEGKLHIELEKEQVVDDFMILPAHLLKAARSSEEGKTNI